MAHPVQNINHSAFRSMFEREKLSGNNFNDWFCQLKLDLRVKKKMYVIEQHLHAAPAADSIANVLAEWNAIYDAYNEKQAEMERFYLIQTFHACKQEEGKPVAAYVLQMKGYIDQLERGLHAMLIEYENGLTKKAETPQVMLIKGGKIQKSKKESLKAKGKDLHRPSLHHHLKVGIHYLENSLIWYRMVNQQSKVVARYNLCQDKKLKMYSLGSTSGIRASEEALNKKNQFHYTQDLDRALTELQKRLDLAETKKEGIQLNVNKLNNASKSLNNIIECQIVNNCKMRLGYNVVPPPHKGLFPPPKSNLSSTGLEELFNEPKTEKSKDKSNDVEPESVRKGSDAPIIKDWVLNDEEERVVRPVWNNSRRVNHKNFANKLTHPHPKRRFAPQAVLMRSGQVSLNVRQIVNSAKSVSIVINRAHSTVRSLFNQRTTFKNRNMNQKVNAVKRNLVNTVVGNEVYVVKASGYKDCSSKGVDNLKKKVKKLERKRRFITPEMNLFKIGTSRKRSLGEDDASKQGRNLKHRSIFEESDIYVQAMMDAYYELAARLD
nr:hypothetical protein [Tanacetum cinerariifolium]